jgi:hypothetical protein
LGFREAVLISAGLVGGALLLISAVRTQRSLPSRDRKEA